MVPDLGEANRLELAQGSRLPSISYARVAFAWESEWFERKPGPPQ